MPAKVHGNVHFDLLPDEPKQIEFITKAKAINNLKLKTFNNLIR